MWLYVKYSGDYREIGQFIDNVTSAIWDQVCDGGEMTREQREEGSWRRGREEKSEGGGRERERGGWERERESKVLRRNRGQKHL